MIEFIKEIFSQNAFTSIKAAAVILLLFILTKPITKHYTAGFRYYSWLAVMIIFLVPFAEMGMNYRIDITPAAANIRNEMHNIRNWYDEHTPTHLVTEEYNDYEQMEIPDSRKSEYVSVVKTTTAKKQVDIMAILAFVWLIGAFTYFILHFVRYISFRHGLKRLYEDIDDDRIYVILEQEKQRLGISKNIHLKLFPIIDTPLLAGLFNPEIILPNTDYTDDELHLILRHELFHFKRKDILYQMITLIFVSLHWFNPIVHIMACAIEIDGETSCDEKTLEGQSYEEKIFYGEMLIKFLKTETQKKSYMTTTFFGGKNGMKKRLTLIADKMTKKKGTAAMAVVMVIATITSISTAVMGNEYFESIFDGDASYLADFIKTEKKSVEDDRFKLTLEQYLVAEKQAMLICSFEAKTEDAVQEMNAVDEMGWSTFNGMDFLVFSSADYDSAGIHNESTNHSERVVHSYSTGCLGDGKFDTENKKYYILKSDSMENEEKNDFYLKTDRIKNSPKIIVPMDYNIETKTVEFDDMKVEYNPISITVTYPHTAVNDDCNWCEFNGNYFYFRMKNGKVKNFYKLYEHISTDHEYDENDNEISRTIWAWSRSVIKPDDIQSIIVNDTEYPFDNPVQSKAVTIDDDLKPFVINAYVKDYLRLPLRELCDGLGAELKWDSDTQSAEVKYRNSTYVFTVGSTQVQVNGETVDFYEDEVFIDENGRIIVPFGRIEDYMDIDCHGINYWDENGNMKSDAKIHVFP